MRDRVFIDTNILVYAYSEDEHEKRKISVKTIKSNNAVVSIQELHEFSNTLQKKYKVNWNKIKMAIDEITISVSVFINQIETVKNAATIAEKYKYSFYDSLIIASALEANCKILYSEDLQHEQLIDKKLKIINPFL